MTAIPCRDDQHHPDQWFSDTPSGLAAAAKLCAGCPIATKCLEVAMHAEAGYSLYSRYGVFGGLTPTQRYALAQHPNPNIIGGGR